MCGRVGPPLVPAAGNAVEARWWIRPIAHIRVEITHDM
ncbi:hypothetical protein BLSMQ_3454 [Brevibacterium aurantiacum]|uniref:Uncharacterized protein n=1 Tax=Brevibacterium aurantiacum TaxID=273384 RepID=A0A1D7W834_BREAU|nr:hypothetical protein BLSMQ_3454 [Brevibacterium aurantiacum]